MNLIWLGWSPQHYSLQKGLMTERHHHHVKLIWLGCLTAHGWNNGPEFGYFSTWVALCWKPSNHLAATAEGRKKTIHFFGKHKSHHSDHLLGIKKETIFDDNHDNDRKLEQITTISLIYSWKKSMYTLWFSYTYYISI